MNKINSLLDRLIPVTTPLAVVLGLLFPVFFIHFRPFVIVLFGAITFSGALKLTAREIGNAVRSPVPILLFFVSTHIIMPLAALFSSSLFFSNTEVIAGYVLLFAGPTAVSGFIWVMIFRGDKALSLTFILLDTLLAPFIVPATILFFMGAKVKMDMTGITISLLFMVVVPTIIAVALNESSRGKIPKIICPGLDPLSKICLMLVIAANSSAVAPAVNLKDPLIWQITLLCVSLTALGFLLGKFFAAISRCSDQKAISLILAGGLRNNSAVMTIAVAFFPETAVLPAVMSIVFQQTIAAIMGKLIIKNYCSKENP